MKKKIILTAAALLCTLLTPAAQAAALGPAGTPPAHFETAWEQLLEQFGIKKPSGSGAGDSSLGNGSANNGGSLGGSAGSGGVSSAPAQQMLGLVNAERARHGLPALRLDTGMSRAAAVRAAELAKRFSHTRPNGARGLSALGEAGVSYRTAGENIAAGQQTAQSVMDAWMGSSGHRANILSAQFDRLGVGRAVIGGRTYWVQLFAG